MAEHTLETLRHLFDLAIAAGPDQRATLLDRKCGDDAALKSRILAMIAAAEDISPPPADTQATLDVPSVRDRSSYRHIGESIGTMIGPYKLLEEIGEGGFGSVFMAEQQRPVQRRVALKIIKLGMDTRQVVARFEQERQALALMDHPNIARVLDAGATEAGRPFFVMELVKGKPITTFCDEGRLSIDERLELFAQVCTAVQHAHTKGIIHRDIKPSNVLVNVQDSKPCAKVIDFGIAKATAAKLTDKTVFTQHAQIIGTPEYMSPEQAQSSLDIDTRTDVYSLGVLLYELLTGTTPFSGSDLRSAAYDEIRRIIREVDPPHPSKRLSQETQTLAGVASVRRSEPRKLGTTVRGELDWIVMKAIDKDRHRRYETASGLASDVRRYLAGEAVMAAPPGTAYRLRKFIRRNRTPVIAASLVVLALVLGVIGTSIGLLTANSERAAALEAKSSEMHQRTVAQSRLAESQATVKFLDDMLAASDPLAQGKDVTVRKVLDRAAKSMSGQFEKRPLVAARLHATIARTYMGLGEYATALSHGKEALALNRRELGATDPETCRATNELGALLTKSGAHAQAESLLKQAIADHQRLFGRTHELTVQSIDLLATLYSAQTRSQEAAKLVKEVLDIRMVTPGKEHPDTVGSMNTLAVLYTDLGMIDESEKLFQSAIEIQDRVTSPEHPLALELRANMGWMEYQAAMQSRQSDPTNYTRRLQLARTLDEATLKARTRILGEEHPETMTSVNNLATVLSELELYDQADLLQNRDIEVSARLLGEEHPDTITSIANHGNSLRKRQRFDEAITYLDRALKGARKSMPADSQGTAFILGWYGSALRDLGRFAQAEPMLIEARGIIAKTMGEDHDIAAQMTQGLVTLYEAWDKASPAKGYDSKAAEWKAKRATKSPEKK